MKQGKATKKRTAKRQPHKRKASTSGHKSSRGVPELYDELKAPVNVSLTPKCVDILDYLADLAGHSRSEVVERLTREIAHASDDPVIQEIMQRKQPKRR